MRKIISVIIVTILLLSSISSIASTKTEYKLPLIENEDINFLENILKDTFVNWNNYSQNEQIETIFTSIKLYSIVNNIDLSIEQCSALTILYIHRIDHYFKDKLFHDKTLSEVFDITRKSFVLSK